MQTINTPTLMDRAIRPLHEFLKLESAGGLILMAAAAAAMIVANSPLAAHYLALLDLRVTVSFGDAGIAKPLLLWINDGLMAVFFLLVGLELKREVVDGHLSSISKASLPAIGALGGLLTPAAIYLAFNRMDPGAARGWAIPSATDIAFALGVLSLVGKRVPPALKAFLLSVAIFDDLGAIIIIALFYTADLSGTALAVAAAVTLALLVVNRMRVTRPAAYIVLGVPLWVALLKSGVHATLAGVLLAMFIPIHTGASPDPQDHGHDHPSLLHRLEHMLHPWVAFGVLPVFAFANAGVSLAGLSAADLLHPVPLGIALGLVLGKQVGIMLVCAIAVKLRLATLPVGVRWVELYGVAVLCGIGFTMSLFIASLAFSSPDTAYHGLERLGILTGSLVSAVIGFIVLRQAVKSRPVDPAN